MAQDYPAKQMEILVLDGMSDDTTRSIVLGSAKVDQRILLIDNLKRNVPAAMNLGIQKSKGEFIVRIDSHAKYPENYISTLIDLIVDQRADLVGSVMKTEAQNSGFWSASIVAALTDRMGVGNSQFRIGSKGILEVDTVPFGCFRRDVFERFGSYDERLLRNQDIELNKRIKAGGGKILITSQTHCTYLSRSTLHGFFKNKFRTGRWVIRTAHLTNNLGSLSLRHFVPLGFCFYLICSPILAIWSMWLLIPLFLYVMLVVLTSVKIVFRERRIGEIFQQLFAFIGLHVSYGIGSLMGILDVILRRKF